MMRIWMIFGIIMTAAFPHAAIAERGRAELISNYLSQDRIVSTLFNDNQPTTRVVGKEAPVEWLTKALRTDRPGRLRRAFFSAEIYIVAFPIGDEKPSLRSEPLVAMGVPTFIAEHIVASALASGTPCSFGRFDQNDYAHSGYVAVPYRDDEDLAKSYDCVLAGFDYLSGFPVREPVDLSVFPDKATRLRILDLVRSCKSAAVPGMRVGRQGVVAHPSIDCMRDRARSM